MLQLLRRGVKTWVAKALLGLLILSFAVWGIGGEIFNFSLSTGVARVGETKITAERFIDAFQQRQNQLGQRTGEVVTVQTMRDLGVDQQIISRLQREAAYDEELKRMGVRIPNEAAFEALRQQPEFQNSDGSLSVQAVQFALGRLGITEAELLDRNRTIVASNLLTGAAIAPTTAPPGVAARIAAYQGETRRIATMILAVDEASDPGTPDEGQIRAFYDENPARYTEPERRWGKFIHVDIEALAADLQPDEAALRETYEIERETYSFPDTREVDQLSMPDMAAAEAAIARIRNGETTFDDLVAEQGFEPGDVDLGQVRVGDLPAATDAAIFAATEPGILDAIPLPVGAAIVRVRSVTEAGVIAFDTLRDQLADRIARDAALEKAPDLANQIDEMRAGGSSFADIATAVRLPLGTFDGLGPDGTLAEGETNASLQNPVIAGEIFEALDGEERAVMETGDGGFVLVQVDRIEPTGLQPIETVRDRVLADWQTDQRLSDLMLRGEKTANLIDSGATLAALASATGKELGTPEPFTRDSGLATLPPAIVTAAFDGTEGNGIAAALPDGSGVLVAEVTQRITLPAEVVANTTAQIEELLQQSIRTDAAELYIREMMAGHEIGQDPEALEEVFDLLSGNRHGGY